MWSTEALCLRGRLEAFERLAKIDAAAAVGVDDGLKRDLTSCSGLVGYTSAICNVIKLKYIENRISKFIEELLP